MTGWFTNYEDNIDKENKEKIDWNKHTEVLAWDKAMLQYIFDKFLLEEYKLTLKVGEFITERKWQQWRLLKIQKIFHISESLFAHMQRDMAKKMLVEEANMFTKEKEKMK